MTDTPEQPFAGLDAVVRENWKIATEENDYNLQDMTPEQAANDMLAYAADLEAFMTDDNESELHAAVTEIIRKINQENHPPLPF